MRKFFSRFRWITLWILSTLVLTLLAGCLAPRAALPTPTRSATATHTPIPPTLRLTPTATQTAIPTQTSTPEPAGCQKPPEDYTRLEVNGQTINQRTLAMLTH